MAISIWSWMAKNKIKAIILIIVLIIISVLTFLVGGLLVGYLIIRSITAAKEKKITGMISKENQYKIIDKMYYAVNLLMVNYTNEKYFYDTIIKNDILDGLENILRWTKFTDKEVKLFRKINEKLGNKSMYASSFLNTTEIEKLGYKFKRIKGNFIDPREVNRVYNMFKILYILEYFELLFIYNINKLVEQYKDKILLNTIKTRALKPYISLYPDIQKINVRNGYNLKNNQFGIIKDIIVNNKILDTYRTIPINTFIFNSIKIDNKFKKNVKKIKEKSEKGVYVDVKNPDITIDKKKLKELDEGIEKIKKDVKKNVKKEEKKEKKVIYVKKNIKGIKKKE